ncbi:MAG: fibronectin type III domain-containing protein, partial [Myxococcales bacterium]|nr:fibronectin type III domain-containing protein [Myxococcales bacterium]
MRRVRLLPGLFALAPVLALLAAPAASFAQALVAGPYLQQATPTGIWIVWETTSGEESRVDWGTTPALGQTAYGETLVSEGTARIHQTELAGLTPDTRYYYQVTTGAAGSAVRHFRSPAAPSADKPLRIVAFSDTQLDFLNLSQFGKTVNDGVIDFMQDNYGPDVDDALSFVLIPGDLVDNGSVHADWQEQFFGEGRNLFQTVPLYPVLGNHERDDPLYFKYFRLPTNGTPGFEE